MKDIMKLAEETWGSLWAVDAEDLPKFSKKSAGVHHLWWDCVALNKHVNSWYLKLKQIRHREGNQPACFWNTGVVTKDRTTLPLSEHMKAEDQCHE
eukprot:3590488-Heterocapsa_arctica.AAC.1